MAVPDFAAIRAGVATNLDTCTEPIRVHDFAPDALAGPAVYVDVPTIVRKETPTTWRLHVPIVLAVSSLWDRAAEAEMNRLIGPVITAIESDRTADGAVTSLALLEPAFVPNRVTLDGVEYMGGTFTVEVFYV